MPLETATTIAGLNALWPLGSDSKGQGDDHIRLIKSVLQTDPTIAAGLVAQTRNRVVNPCFQISQENGNTAVGINGAYAADQWVGANTSAGAAFAQRVQVVTPNGSQNRLRMWVSTIDAAIAAGDYMYIGTALEGVRVADFGWGTAAAKQVVLRFGFKGQAGTYGVRLYSGTHSYVADMTISAGQANTDTVQTFVIPGATTGTWNVNTAAGAYLSIAFAAGTTFQGVAGWQAGNILGTSAITNNIGVINNTFELFDVGLYLDPDATGKAPKWVMPDEAEELAACERYWVKVLGNFSGNTTNAMAYQAASGAVPVAQRIVPTLSGVNNNANGFPTTVGAIGSHLQGRLVYEQRVANIAGTGSYFSSIINCNARM